MKVRVVREPRVGGSRLPCRGQEAPQRALEESVRLAHCGCQRRPPSTGDATIALVMLALMLAAQLAGAPHWPAGARVAVWIDTSRAPANAAMLVERAMRVWTEASDGRLTLVRAAARADAAIRVLFGQSDTNYGEAAPRVDPATGFIARADVAINAAVPDDPIDARIVVYLTALHELGTRSVSRTATRSAQSCTASDGPRTACGTSACTDGSSGRSTTSGRRGRRGSIRKTSPRCAISIARAF